MKSFFFSILFIFSAVPAYSEVDPIIDEELAPILGEAYLYLSRFYTVSGQYDPYTQHPVIWANALLGKGKHPKTKRAEDGHWLVTEMIPSDTGIVMTFYSRGGPGEHARPIMTFHDKDKRVFEHSIQLSKKKVIVVSGSYGDKFPPVHIDSIYNEILKKQRTQL